MFIKEIFKFISDLSPHVVMCFKFVKFPINLVLPQLRNLTLEEIKESLSLSFNLKIG